MGEDDDKLKDAQKIGVFITIPFVLAVPPVVGWFIGSALDKLLGTNPYFMYFFLIMGFVAGFREIFRIVKRFGGDGS